MDLPPLPLQLEPLPLANEILGASSRALGLAKVHPADLQHELHDVARRLAESLHTVLAAMPGPDDADARLLAGVAEWL